MDTETLRALSTPSGQATLARARISIESGATELAVLSDVRRTHDAAFAAAVLGQLKLRDKARAKFGDRAEQMLVLPNSLEQSSRVEVSGERARQLVAAGIRNIVDAGAGIGADSIAYAEAGLHVLAIERDPVVAAALRHNVRGLSVDVVDGDALDVLASVDSGVVFFDPARRVGGRRIFDPEECSPALSALTATADRGIRVVAKMSPSLDLAAVPPGWDADWVSTQTEQGRAVVEATLWSPPLGEGTRRAKVLSSGRPPVTLTALGGTPNGEIDNPIGYPGGPLCRYIYEPDGAVNQAGLTDQLARTLQAHRLEPHIAYLTADRPCDTPFARGYEVLESLTWSKRALARALTKYDASDLIIKKRGVSIDPTALRRELLPRLRSGTGEPLTVILTPHAGVTIAILSRAL